MGVSDPRIEWWIDLLRSNPSHHSIRDRSISHLDLQPSYDKHLDSDLRSVDILEIFGGPLTSLGNRSRRRSVNIVQLEPQAERLSRVLKECGLSSRGKLVAGEVHDLPTLWPVPSFDLVICPLTGFLKKPIDDFRAMLAVLRTGGTLLITMSFGTRPGSPGWFVKIGKAGLVICSDNDEVPLDTIFAGDSVRTSWQATAGLAEDAKGWVTIEVQKKASPTDRIRRSLDDFASTSAAIDSLYGVALDENDLGFIANFFGRKPDGTVGSILPNDAAFLLSWMKLVRPSSMLEIGVSSGVSSAFILEAAEWLGLIKNGFVLDSLDLLSYVYARPSDKVGWVVDLLPARLRERFNLITGATTTDVASFIKRKAISKPDLVFLDAEHAHPGPSIDLKVLCDTVGEGCWILLHDICLYERAIRDSFVSNERPSWMLRGAEWAFEFWPGEKFRGAGEMSNVGAVRAVAGLTRTRAWAALMALPHEQKLTPEIEPS